MREKIAPLKWYWVLHIRSVKERKESGRGAELHVVSVVVLWVMVPTHFFGLLMLANHLGGSL